MEILLKIILLAAALYILIICFEYILALILLVPFLLIVGFIAGLI